MSEVISVRLGDVGDVRKFKLNGVSDLSAATLVQAIICRPGVYPVIAPVTLTGAVVDPIACIVSINFGNAGGWLPTVAVLGDYTLAIRVTFGLTPIITWPNSDPLYILRVGRTC